MNKFVAFLIILFSLQSCTNATCQNVNAILKSAEPESAEYKAALINEIKKDSANLEYFYESYLKGQNQEFIKVKMLGILSALQEFYLCAIGQSWLTCADSPVVTVVLK